MQNAQQYPAAPHNTSICSTTPQHAQPKKPCKLSRKRYGAFFADNGYSDLSGVLHFVLYFL